MARETQHRRIEERIFDVIRSARALDFKIVIGDPAVKPGDIQRVEPVRRPTDEQAKLTFYIGRKAWEQFKAAYLDITSDESFLVGIEIVYYQPPPEKVDGAP